MLAMDNYRTSSHSRYDIKYHFVWVTKYRKPVLTGEVVNPSTFDSKTQTRPGDGGENFQIS